MNLTADRVLIEPFKVHSYEVDCGQRATLKALCHYFQEAAWNHAERLGVGYNQLQQQQRLWVLSRLRIHIQHYPAWGETVAVRTWPRQARSVFALRDFQILDQGQNVMVAGSSAWLVLDSTTRRPLRADKMLADFTDLLPDRALDCDPEKIPPGTNPTSSTIFTANYSDLDVNGHANYAWYIGCALSSHPELFHREHEPHALAVNYLGETGAGETVSVLTHAQSGQEHIYSIQKSSSSEEVCRLQVHWRRKRGDGRPLTLEI